MNSRITRMALVLGAMLAILFAGQAVATKPAPEHRVTICHATPPDTAAQGWHAITVDVASVGYQQSGHQDQHAADIIPPYAYGDFAYAGKNWDAVGQSIWENECTSPEPSASPSPSPEPSYTPSPEPTATPTPTPSPSVTPGPTPLLTPSVALPTPPPTSTEDPQPTPASALPNLLMVTAATLAGIILLRWAMPKRH